MVEKEGITLIIEEGSDTSNSQRGGVFPKPGSTANEKKKDDTLRREKRDTPRKRKGNVSFPTK